MPLLRPSEGNLGQCFGMFKPSGVILWSARARTFLLRERFCASSSMERNTWLKTLRVRTCAHFSVARARLRKQQHQEEHFAQNAACAHVRACFCCARICANNSWNMKKHAQNTACAHVRARFQRSQPLPSTPPSRRLLAAFSPASRRLLAAFSPA